MYKGANEHWALERLFFPTTILPVPVLELHFPLLLSFPMDPAPGPSFLDVPLPEQTMPDRVAI